MIVFLLIVFLSLTTKGKFVGLDEVKMKETIDQAFNWILSVSSNGEFSEINTNQNEYDLYSGSAGVLVYTLELYEFTKDERILNLSKSIADNLLQQFTTKIEPKFDLSFFHKGLSGIAFSFHVLNDHIPNEKYENFANSLDQTILSRFKDSKMPNCLRWGYAGTALYALWLYDRATSEVEKEMILSNCTAGVDKVLDNAVKDHDGVKWYYEGKLGYNLPGYADGTAGIVYMLLKMYEETKDSKYLDYAKKGIVYLKSIANFSDNGCLIFHSNNPFDKAKYYLGECNGNTGHLKSFLKMYDVTKEQEYLDLAIKSGNSLLKFYPTYNWWLPTKQKDFWFWNTMSLCDGSVGVIESLNILRQFDVERKEKYDQVITDIVNNIISRKTFIAKGDLAYWTQAENRDQPKKTWNQVGMYQGAAGITMTFIHLLSKIRIKLPDYLF